jgi:dienelactone hydrolase
MFHTRWMNVLFVLLFTSFVRAEVTTEPIPYTHDNVALQGYLAVPDGEARGAVLVVHEWWGLNDYAKRRARMLAELGYVAFAVDMYGKGKVTDSVEQAGKWSGEIAGDRAHYRARVLAGLGAFKGTGKVTEGMKVAAIGYCFGGTTVTELAYSGADLVGVVSFHGNPKPPLEDDTIHAAILFCHGDADPLVPDDVLNAATDGLDAKGVDWQLIRYSGAKHAFSNPKADSYGLPPVGYNEKADKRAWTHMRVFFDELFASE